MNKKFANIGITVIFAFIAFFASDPLIELIYKEIDKSLVQASGGLEAMLKLLKIVVGFLRVDVFTIILLLIPAGIIIYNIIKDQE